MLTFSGVMILATILSIAGLLGLLLGRVVLAWSWLASGALAVGFIFLAIVILFVAFFWLLSQTDIG